MNVFIPIAKVDAQRREVWGYAAEEAPDKSGEIMDYESSKPLFLEWSAQFDKATDGKSLGNVRAMHGHVAAGKLIAFEPQDAEKRFYVGAHIVDDAEWNKVEAGVYTGFSVGGSYARKWADPTNRQLQRYTAKPAEMSLVDNPCMYGATFQMQKADGLEPVAVAFVGEGSNAELATMAGTLDNLLTLAKAGARHSASDTAAIQSIHDAAGKLGAACGEVEKDAGAEDLAKGDERPAWITAAFTGRAINGVADVLSMLADLTNSLNDFDPEAAKTVATAAQLIGGTIADLTAQMATATAEHAAATAAAELMAETAEAAATATTMAMMAKLTADDSPLLKFTQNATDPAAMADTLAKLLEPITTANVDVVARLGALETATQGMQKRVEASGPIVRNVPLQATESGTTETAVLQKMIDAEIDPNTRQILQTRLSRLQIAGVHASGGVRIG